MLASVAQAPALSGMRHQGRTVQWAVKTGCSTPFMVGDAVLSIACRAISSAHIRHLTLPVVQYHKVIGIITHGYRLGSAEASAECVKVETPLAFNRG